VSLAKELSSAARVHEDHHVCSLLAARDPALARAERNDAQLRIPVLRSNTGRMWPNNPDCSVDALSKPPRMNCCATVLGRAAEREQQTRDAHANPLQLHGNSLDEAKAAASVVDGRAKKRSTGA
jgi:hypothetical protein